MTTAQHNRIGQRIGDNGLYPPRAFANGDVYILDDVDPEAADEQIGGRAIPDVHSNKCGYIRDLFSDLSDYKVHTVRFPPGTKKKGFWDYWDRELRSKNIGDLIIIYFHGTAGSEETSYTWSLSQTPRCQINAHRFIAKVNESKAHSMFLLDCFIHTRITSKWKLKCGNTEIIARPEGMVSGEGRAVKHKREFTEAMVINLREFHKGSKGRFKYRKSMITIPKIMAKDKEIHSNNKRIWFDRSRAGMTKVVERFALNPGMVRVTGKLEFFAVQIRGERVDAPKARQAGDDSEEESDEGFGDDDELGSDDEDEDGDGTDGSDNAGDDGDSLFVPP